MTLRAYRQDELDDLVDLVGGLPTDDGTYSGPRDREAMKGKIERSATWTDAASIEFAVEAQGRLVGEVQARQPRYGLPPGVFELGLEVFRGPDRGQGLGSAILIEISRFLFEQEGAIRVQLSTDVDNAAMRRCAEVNGFRFEGVLRGFMPTSRGPRDYAMFGMTNRDYEEVKPRWI